MSDPEKKKAETTQQGTEPGTAKKKKKRKTSPVTILVLLFCIGVFCYAGYQLASIYLEYGKAESEYKELVSDFQVPVDTDDTDTENVTSSGDKEELDPMGWPRYAVDIETLQQLNSDIIGWIYIPDTKVNYPVVRGEDNSYYINRTFRLTYNSSGSIFMDYANQPDFTDLNTILYGHNMKNGAMFGSLKKYYQEEGYAYDHPYFYIYTPDKKWNKYQIFSCYHTQADSSSYDYVTEDMYEKYVQRAKSHSAFNLGVDVDTENKKTIVTLSTCSGKTGGTQRFLIHGVWIDEKVTED
ncbi:MAG: class B sortase [Lachnospiraceae bacterium]|nr:class B sortase [Lachnospiraceae bacterium]